MPNATIAHSNTKLEIWSSKSVYFQRPTVLYVDLWISALKGLEALKARLLLSATFRWLFLFCGLKETIWFMIWINYIWFSLYSSVWLFIKLNIISVTLNSLLLKSLFLHSRSVCGVQSAGEDQFSSQDCFY